VRRVKLSPYTWAIREGVYDAANNPSGTSFPVFGGFPIKVAGKTGTAETCACNRVYDAWFIFFAPADKPTIAGAVVVELQENGFGGAVAAPIAKQLMQALLPTASNG
jgi:penicillin-binding protein 2